MKLFNPNKIKPSSERHTVGRRFDFGQRRHDSLKADVASCLTNFNPHQNKPNPLFDEAIYMIKAEIKTIKTRITKRKARSYDEDNLAEAMAMIPEIEKLQQAHQAYADAFQNITGATAFSQ